MTRNICALLALSLLLIGCSSRPYTPMPDGWRQADQPIGVLYIAPQKEMYLEIPNDDRRYADVEVNVGVKLLANVSGASIGVGAGYAIAVATGPADSIVVVNPVGAAIVLAAAVAGPSIEAAKQMRARGRAKSFNELLDADTGHALLFSALNDQLASGSNLGFAGIKPQLIHGESFNSFSDTEMLELVDTDRTLVYGSIAAFTPRFEVLEVTVVYGILDTTKEEPEVLYANSVLVQSMLREGLDGSDASQDLEHFLGRKMAEELEKMKSSRDFQDPYSRARQVNKLKWKYGIEKYQQHYFSYDDRDVDGETWLADDARFAKQQLAEVYREAARLMAGDLNGLPESKLTGLAKPPGYDRAMYQLPALATDTRDVYQLTEGPIISKRKNVWMVPLSADTKD